MKSLKAPLLRSQSLIEAPSWQTNVEDPCYPGGIEEEDEDAINRRHSLRFEDTPSMTRQMTEDLPERCRRHSDADLLQVGNYRTMKSGTIKRRLSSLMLPAQKAIGTIKKFSRWQGAPSATAHYHLSFD